MSGSRTSNALRTIAKALSPRDPNEDDSFQSWETFENVKDRLLRILMESPEPASLRMRWWLNQASDRAKASAVIQALGMRQAKVFFDEISESQWADLAQFNAGDSTNESSALPQAIKDLEEQVKSENADFALSRFYRILSDAAKNLDTSPTLRLLSIIREKSTQEIAPLSRFWTPDEMSTVLEALQPKQRAQTLLFCHRLDRLPGEASLLSARRTADAILAKLDEMIGEPVVREAPKRIEKLTEISVVEKPAVAVKPKAPMQPPPFRHAPPRAPGPIEFLEASRQSIDDEFRGLQISRKALLDSIQERVETAPPRKVITLRDEDLEPLVTLPTPINPEDKSVKSCVDRVLALLNDPLEEDLLSSITGNSP
jgi:hypothetical protein